MNKTDLKTNILKFCISFKELQDGIINFFLLQNRKTMHFSF